MSRFACRHNPSYAPSFDVAATAENISVELQITCTYHCHRHHQITQPTVCVFALEHNSPDSPLPSRIASIRSPVQTWLCLCVCVCGKHERLHELLCESRHISSSGLHAVWRRRQIIYLSSSVCTMNVCIFWTLITNKLQSRVLQASNVLLYLHKHCVRLVSPRHRRARNYLVSI